MKIMATSLIGLGLAVSMPAMAVEEHNPQVAEVAAPEVQAPQENQALTEAEIRRGMIAKGKVMLKMPMDYDITYGSESAPVKIVEYASLSCSHCKDFYENVFTDFKKNYIDTGKVRFVYRHYPLNINALRAAMVLECGVPEAKRQEFIGVMFKTQSEWAYKPDEKDVVDKLASIAKIGGIDSSKFQACLKDKELEEKMLKNQLEAQKNLQVTSTPTIFINGKKYFKDKKIEIFTKAVDSELKEVGEEK